MNQDVFNMITALVAVSALIISIFNLLLNKRNLITNNITSNRIEWINDLRNLLVDFCEEYIKNNNPVQKKIIKSKVDLYIRYNSQVYEELNYQLEKCINETYTEENYYNLIVSAQQVLNSVWHRMKREAGISRFSELRMKQKLKKEKIDLEKNII